MIEKLLTSIRHVTEKAAIASYDWIGKNNENEADRAAVNAMREELNKLEINASIVIGEGERDEAPMLYIGEKLGNGQGPKVDIAVDPLEGTRICAQNERNSLSVIAVAKSGNLLYAPDVYMEKIAIGPGLPEGIIDLDNSTYTNLSNLAKAKKCSISDLKIIILDRPRHEELIAKVKENGAKVSLIKDGDISAVIATSYGKNKIDAYMGTGGAPEGVLAAAALATLGGQITGRLLFDDEAKKLRALQMRILDLRKKYYLNDLVKNDVIFVLTGVTAGDFVQGVQLKENKIITESLVMYSKNKYIDKIIKEHSKNG